MRKKEQRQEKIWMTDTDDVNIYRVESTYLPTKGLYYVDFCFFLYPNKVISKEGMSDTTL